MNFLLFKRAHGLLFFPPGLIKLSVLLYRMNQKCYQRNTPTDENSASNYIGGILISSVLNFICSLS